MMVVRHIGQAQPRGASGRADHGGGEEPTEGPVRSDVELTVVAELLALQLWPGIS